MNRTDPTRTPAAAPAAEFVAFGAVHLDVTAAERSLAFWRDRVGLQLRGEEDGSLHLGTDDQALLVLHRGATSPVRRGGGAFLSNGDGLHGVLRSGTVRQLVVDGSRSLYSINDMLPITTWQPPSPPNARTA